MFHEHWKEFLVVLFETHFLCGFSYPAMQWAFLNRLLVSQNPKGKNPKGLDRVISLPKRQDHRVLSSDPPPIIEVLSNTAIIMRWCIIMLEPHDVYNRDCSFYFFFFKLIKGSIYSLLNYFVNL
jgi:hypothetical protein